ncbi:hypothetical protein NXF25_014139, partial [Crotalus adamanteus]
EATYSNLSGFSEAAEKRSAVIFSFLSSGGAQSVPAVLKRFKAKTLAQLLHGAQLNPGVNYYEKVERVPHGFLEKWFRFSKMCI